MRESEISVDNPPITPSVPLGDSTQGRVSNKEPLSRDLFWPSKDR